MFLRVLWATLAKEWNLRRRFVGTSDLPVGQKQGRHLGLWLAPKVGWEVDRVVVGQLCRTEPSAYRIWSSVQVDTIKIELNFMIPDVWKLFAGCVGNPPPHIEIRSVTPKEWLSTYYMASISLEYIYKNDLCVLF